MKLVREMLLLARDIICAPSAVFSKINEGKLVVEVTSVFALSVGITCLKGYWRAVSGGRSSLTFFENDSLNQVLESGGHPVIALLVMYLVYGVFIAAALAVSRVAIHKAQAKRFVMGLFAISALAVCAHFVFGILSFLPLSTALNWTAMLVYMWVSILTIIVMKKILGLSLRASMATFAVSFVALFPFSLHFGLAPYLSWLSNP